MFTQSVLLQTIVTLVLVASTHPSIYAQGTKADYERANNLRSSTSGKVFRSEVRANWIDDEGNDFWYRVRLPEDKSEFILVRPEKGTRTPLFDSKKLAEALHKASGQAVQADKLPFDYLKVELGKALQFNAFGKGWKLQLDSYSISEVDKVERPRSNRDSRRRRGSGSNYWGRFGSYSSESKNKKWKASIKNHNVFIKNLETDEETQLTQDGSEEHYYSGRFLFSPDSKRLMVLKTRKEQEHLVYYIESSPKDQVQPKLHKRQYLKPGDRVAQTFPHLFNLETLQEIPVKTDLFSNPYHTRHFRWEADSKRFTLLYNQRGHQVVRIVGIDSDTGETGLVINEESKTFIDYSHKLYVRYLEDSNELIWLSERDGWNHLYLYDKRTGSVKNQITKGEWVVRGIERIDEEKRQIWFRASGLFPEQDPYYIHYCRVNFDGSEMTILTRGNGTHSIRYSPDRKFIVDTYSRVDMAPVVELRKVSDGSLVVELERGDLSRLVATGWKTPERFVTKGRDGKTDIYGVIFRPTNFDPKKKYPVIEKIYAGPHGSFVPKSFSSYYSAQAMAELGFILVQIDGMGTSNRSKAFHNICWKNLGDSGFPDRILWMQAAQKKYPYMDLKRVGIYGGSAGGQSSTRALLAFGDFYKVAVSDCGCHDNRMDKIWWNEQWMGWPIGPHYEEQSNVTQAHKLKGKLFLMVGEMDTNVDPASTLQVVNALIKADKDFDLLFVPGGGHGTGGKYGNRRRRDYFVRHLLGVEPRSK